MTDSPQSLAPVRARKKRARVLTEMTSLRFSKSLLAQARQQAEDDGETLSDLFRTAVAAELRRRGRQRAA